MAALPAPAKASQIGETWALFVMGGDEWMIHNPLDLWYILTDCYGVKEDHTSILYPRDKYEVRNAITGWLAQNSNYGDLVLIYFATHGGGYNTICNEMHSGRIDEDGDEGLEWFNQTSKQWVGIDECLQAFYNRDLSDPIEDKHLYWDDELKEDLKTVRYGRMIICIESCKLINSTEDGFSCYCGGFIDDISGPRRIIITSTNETTDSYADEYYEDDSPIPTLKGTFFKGFIEAFDTEGYWTGNKPWEDDFPNRVADVNGDGAVSILEAFNYALQHDACGPNGSFDTSPWLDDNGNRLPTYYNGSDWLDPNDGSFAALTWFNLSMYTGNAADVDNDGIVDMMDVRIVAKSFGGFCDPYANELWNPLADINCDNVIDIEDIRIAAKNFGWTKP